MIQTLETLNPTQKVWSFFMNNLFSIELVGDMIKSRNTQDAQDLNNKLKVVSSHVAKANSVQSDLLDQVDDYDTKANTLTVLGNASRAYQQFGDDINNEIMADFIDTINAVSDSKASHTHFGIAYTSADLESATQSANATLKFGEKCNQLDTLLIHIANRVGIQNEKTAEDILLKKQKLRALLPGLISAIDIRAASNKDPASIGLLNTMVAMWESDVKDIRNLVLDAFDGVDIVTGTG